MDKRIIILIVIFLAGSLSFFLYRKLYFKQDRVHLLVRPQYVSVGDSVSYSSRPSGTSRWKYDFDDDEFSVADSGKHAFLQPGAYNVKMTAYGPFGVFKDSVLVNVKARQEISAVKHNAQIKGISNPTVYQHVDYECDIEAESYAWYLEGNVAAHDNVQTGKVAAYTFTTPGIRKLLLIMHGPDDSAKLEIHVIGKSVKHGRHGSKRKHLGPIDNGLYP